MEQSLREAQRRLSVKASELLAARQHIEQLEETLGERCYYYDDDEDDFMCFCLCLPEPPPLPPPPSAALSQRGTRQQEEASGLQRSVSTLDRQKDLLQEEVDQRAERLLELTEELAVKVERGVYSPGAGAEESTHLGRGRKSPLTWGGGGGGVHSPGAGRLLSHSFMSFKVY